MSPAFARAHLWRNRDSSSVLIRTLRPFAALFALLAIAPTTPANAEKNVDGDWSPVFNWPLISVHAALTPDMRVLSYGTNGDGRQTGFFIYDVWDPSVGASASGHMTLANMTLTDLFCSSQVILPQSGEIFIVGGDNWAGPAEGTTNTGNNNSNLFDYTDNTLVRSASMFRARWYSSSTVMIDGEVYIQGGNGGGDMPEVRQTNGEFRALSNVSTTPYVATFPRNFVAPDGRVFGYDHNGKMYYVDYLGTGVLSAAGQLPSANAGWGSSQVMFRPNRILQIGGNSNGSAIIDINGPFPVMTSSQSMSTRRVWVSATVLADGKVLGTGGSQSENELIGVNNSAEIWNPATGTWHVGDAAVKARLYHSAALLLPDASVLVSGGGAPGPQTNTNAEIYYPPYLYDENDAFAARPTIVSATDTAEVGDLLDIQVDIEDVSAVNLVKTGSVTHSVNMDQRFLTLPFTQSGNMVQAALPVRATDTPPGYYMMFVLDGAGVPSMASMLRINIDATPFVAVDYTPTVGGSGGTPFQLSCPSHEIIVGVHGRYETVVNRIGPRCVKIDQLGRWIGDPVNGPVTGTSATGTAFTKSCPRDHAVSGFRGRAGTSVNQIEIQCRALTSTGSLTGPVQYLGGDGGTGGSAQGPFACGTGNPVYALYGRSGTGLNNFGVLCRQAAVTPISINSSPVIVNPGSRSDAVGLPVSLQIQASDSDDDDLTFSATNLPAGLSIDTDTGLISGTPTTTTTYSTSVTVSDASESDTAVFSWHIQVAPSLVVTPMPSQPAREAGTNITYTATASGGVNVVYQWEFGDGTPATAYSASNSVSHSFAEPGVYYVTLTVSDDFGNPQIQTFVQAIHLPLTAAPPKSSTNIAYETRSGNDRLWVVNQDNDSVTAIDAITHAKLAEITVGTAPRSVAIAPDGRVWVTNKRTSTISIVNPVTFAVVQTVSLPYGSAPYGLVFSPVANEALVVLEARGQLLKLDATSGSQLLTANAGPNPRHVAIDATGSTAYVSRFVTPRQPGEETGVVYGPGANGGEVLVFDAGGLLQTNTIVLQHSGKPDAENQGSGVPNYLGAAALSPDGTAGWVPSKMDNIGRGTLRNGLNLNFQNTVRAIGSRIDLSDGSEDYSDRIDFDDAGIASAAAFDPLGIYMFVSLETSDEVVVVDAHGAFEAFRINTGLAPQGVVVSPDGNTLFVNNFMDRTVGVYDLGDLNSSGLWTVPHLATVEAVAVEKLSPNILAGKRLFYDARDTRLANDRYMSCASCHNDGGQDGRVWDLTGMGEGLRNTVNLNGTGADDGRLHWSQNFDEIQDFEGQIRALAGGTGLMGDAAFFQGTRHMPLGDPKAGLSAELDALAAYVASLDSFAASPHRNTNGTLTSAAQAGKLVFTAKRCATCHGGAEFTDSDGSTLHDIGTLKASSGTRLGELLAGIDTPTLRGTWATAPYLHDGSAATLADAITAHQGTAFSAAELTNLVAYVQQIDDSETTAPPLPPDTQGPTKPTISTITPGNGFVDLVWTVSTDNVGVAGYYVYRSTDATQGPVVATVTGTSWRDTSVTEGVKYTYAVAAFDAAGNTGARSSLRSAIPPSQAPTKPTITTITAGNGYVDLAWTTSTDNVGVAGYYVYRSTDGTQGPVVATVTATSWRDTTVGDGIRYTYAVAAFDAAGNVSARSGLIPITTSAQPPTKPTITTATPGNGFVDLAWTESTDNTGVAGYYVYRSTNGTQGPIVATVTGTNWRDTSVTEGVKYTYAVAAFDTAGNLSTRSGLKSATPPSVAPTKPTLVSVNVVSGKLELTWTASTDNVGVAGYYVYRSTNATQGPIVATVTGTTWLDTTVTQGVRYTYAVAAFDAAGNVSARSGLKSATP